MIEIYASMITGKEISDFDEILPFLSMEKIKRIRSYRNKEDAIRSLLGEWLIRNCINKKFNISQKDIKIDTDEYGKPYLKNCGNYHFNISHSGIWTVCAIGEKPLGIDIELIAPLDLGIGKKFFSKEECNLLFSKNGDERLACFYDIWTVKESFIKAVGKGLSISLDSFTCNFQEGKIAFEGEDLIREDFIYYFRQYGIDKKYKMAISTLMEKFYGEIVIL